MNLRMPILNNNRKYIVLPMLLKLINEKKLENQWDLLKFTRYTNENRNVISQLEKENIFQNSFDIENQKGTSSNDTIYYNQLLSVND